MNEDPSVEPAAAAAATEPTAPARKRTRTRKAVVVQETVVRERTTDDGHASPERSNAFELPPLAIEPRMTSDSMPANVQTANVQTEGQAEGHADGQSDGPRVAGEGERTKRPRRRGRRGKDGKGQDGATAPHPRPEPELRRAELEPQARERLGETFAHVTSDAYDEDATPTDEELRALEERAQEPPVDPSASAAAPGGVDGDDGDGSVASEATSEEASREGAPEGQPARGDHGRRDDRRVLAAQRDAPKLQKVLAQSGAGSRRDIEQWIVDRRVTVNGQAAHTGQRVSFGDRVAIDGKAVRIRIAPLPARVIAYHKPVGEIVTHDDPQQRPTVFRKLPRLAHGKWQSVGRLDINTEGLLLFTNSGELANQLMHPRFGIEREYAVRVLGSLDDEARKKLLEGVDIEGQRAAFLSIDEGGGDGANRWYRVTIAEGRHREVRRLFDAIGLAVSRLIRIRYGAVVLPRGLKRGVWVDLPEGDIRALRHLAGLDRGERAERGPRGDRNARGDRSDRGPREGRDPRSDDSQGKGRRGRGRNGSQGQQGPQAPRQPQDHRGTYERRAPSYEPRDPNRDFGRDGKGRRGGGQGPRGPRGGGGGGGEGAIPNPLMQTYDRRAAQEARRAPQREYGDDGPIPNPLQQNYDQRALRESNRSQRRDPGEDGPIPNPLQQTFDKRQIQGRGDALVLGRQHVRRANPGDQPDPMQTAVGYIGADAFHAKNTHGRGGKGQGRRRR